MVLALGPILDPSSGRARRGAAARFADLCELAGVAYTAPVGVSRKAPGFGTLALGTKAAEASVLPAFDDWNAAWRLFSDTGRFHPVGGAGGAGTAHDRGPGPSTGPWRHV